MAAPVWSNVRKELGHPPIVDGRVGGNTPLYVERYLYQTIERTVSGLACAGLITQFGGGRVDEGERGAWRSSSFPTQSQLFPPDVTSHWHYSGTVDFAVFYLLEPASSIADRLTILARSRNMPMPFSDSLVGAAALQIVTELQKGMDADEDFMQRLASVMLEQTFRVLTTPGTGGINPRHIHFPRLQAVLNHIHAHLAEDLSAESLAIIADVSLTHFRRIFLEALDMPPHRYILATRLERARKLLTQTSLPISRIAQDCGFSSQSHLNTCFRGAHAATPAEFRRQIRQKTQPPV